PVGEADDHDPDEGKQQEKDDEQQGGAQKRQAHPARQEGDFVSPHCESLPTPKQLQTPTGHNGSPRKPAKKSCGRRRPPPPPPAIRYFTRMTFSSPTSSTTASA